MFLDVFCISCSKVICQQCGCFSLVHKGHEMEPLSETHQNVLKKIKSKIEVARTRQSELSQLVIGKF